MKERQNRILKAAVEAYIETGEPVSSKFIIEYAGMDVSSATVRNDLAQLERDGYLEQPHTSAGRIPSELGYRYYVDNLLQADEVEAEQALNIERALENSTSGVDEFLKNALKVFSEITGYTSAAVVSHSNSDKIMKLEVVKTSDSLINLIVITKSGVVKNSFCRLYFLATDEDIAELNNVLEKYLEDTTFGQLEDEQFLELERELASRQKNWDFLAGIIKNIVESIKNPKVLVSGEEKLLSFPEFYEVHKAVNVMTFLKEETRLYDVLSTKASDRLNVIIGSEIGGENLSDMGLVVRKYRASNNDEIAFSLFGPKRMNYSKTISQVEYFTKCIERFLKDRES